MPLSRIKKQIYDFVNLRDDYTYVTLKMIRAFSSHNNITMQEMGYAMQELKAERRLYFTQKRGWRVR